MRSFQFYVLYLQVPCDCEHVTYVVFQCCITRLMSCYQSTVLFACYFQSSVQLQMALRVIFHEIWMMRCFSVFIILPYVF